MGENCVLVSWQEKKGLLVLGLKENYIVHIPLFLREIVEISARPTVIGGHIDFQMY